MIFHLENHEIKWEPRRLIIAGYTSQDEEALNRHILELKKIGVKPPTSIPMIYEISPGLLTHSNQIEVVGNKTNGEAEVVLLEFNKQWYVGLGSDHTDRMLEVESIQKSKQICAKPISKDLWSLEAIEDNWSNIKLNSWITIDGKEELYQSGTLAEFFPIRKLLSIIQKRDYMSSDIAIYCGTLPALNGEFIYGEAFRAELFDEENRKSLELSYKTIKLKNAEEN